LKGSSKSTGFLIFIILLGAILGSLLGDLTGTHVKSLQFMKNIYTIGTPAPIILDFKVLALSFGLNFNVNIMTIFGIILAIIFYRRS
jgi:hypothetical protein